MQLKSAFSWQRRNDANWETTFVRRKGHRQRIQTSANFPKINNRRSREPRTQPLPPTAAHHSLQQLWLPLRQQPLHKMSQRNIGPRGKTGNKTKTTLVFPAPPSFHCDDGNKGIILRLFHPSAVQCYVSVCWTTSGLSWNHCLVKSNSRKSTLGTINTMTYTFYFIFTSDV